MSPSSRSDPAAPAPQPDEEREQTWRTFEQASEARATHQREEIARLTAELAASRAEASALRTALVEANGLVSCGICVIGHKGKDAYIRQIGRVIDDALAALGQEPS